jgi:hypothetical protein
VRADRAPEVCDTYVFWMNGVGVERGAVAEDGDEPRVVRARKMKRVGADREALYSADDGRKTTQARDMLIAYVLFNVGAIFPDNDMSEHFSCINLSSGDHLVRLCTQKLPSAADVRLGRAYVADGEPERQPIA